SHQSRYPTSMHNYRSYFSRQIVPPGSSEMPQFNKICNLCLAQPARIFHDLHFTSVGMALEGTSCTERVVFSTPGLSITTLSGFSRVRTVPLSLQLTESHITDVPLPGGYAGQHEPLITIEESQLDNIAPDKERYRFDRAVIQPGFYFALLKIRPGDKVSI